jgi:hypothetical protein
MSKQSLTRYLYFLEEVKLSFLESLLKKNSLKECYFWISEIFYSGFINECWQLIMKIYYDFYHLNNANIESKINIKFKKKDNIKSILSIVTLLFRSQHDPFVFICRTNNKGRKVKDITKTLLNKLKKNECQSVYYYINLLAQTEYQKCVELIERFKGESFKDNINYNDKIHLLFIFACKKYESNSNIIIKLIKSNITFVQDVNVPVKNIYNTLNKKRLYNISNDIGCFKTFDEKKFDKKKAFCDSWEYYSNFSPIWSERLKCEFKNKIPLFKNIDSEESFYNKYNYEPDEKCDLFVKCNEKSELKLWLQNIYNNRFDKFVFKQEITY